MDAGALVVGQERGGRLLDQLLVAALQRTVAGPQHLDRAVPVGQHLRLDMAGAVQELFDIAFAAAECRDRLARGGVEQLLDLVQIAGHAHAASAAAEGRLDRQGQPVFAGKGQRLGAAGDGAGAARNQGRAHGLGDLSRADLVAKRVDHVGVGPDPEDARSLHRAGEIGVLRQEAIAGMDRVDLSARGDGQHLGRIQIGVGGAVPLQRPGLIGRAHEGRVAVRIGIDRHRFDALVGAGADDAQGDLSAVGDQDAADRGQGGVTKHRRPPGRYRQKGRRRQSGCACRAAAVPPGPAPQGAASR